MSINGANGLSPVNAAITLVVAAGVSPEGEVVSSEQAFNHAGSASGGPSELPSRASPESNHLAPRGVLRHPLSLPLATAETSALLSRRGDFEARVPIASSASGIPGLHAVNANPIARQQAEWIVTHSRLEEYQTELQNLQAQVSPPGTSISQAIKVATKKYELAEKCYQHSRVEFSGAIFDREMIAKERSLLADKIQSERMRINQAQNSLVSIYPKGGSIDSELLFLNLKEGQLNQKYKQSLLRVDAANLTNDEKEDNVDLYFKELQSLWQLEGKIKSVEIKIEGCKQAIKNITISRPDI